MHSGDSYSQTGFVINETKPTAGNILGNPPFPGWTTTDGDNVSEELHTFLFHMTAVMKHLLISCSGLTS